MRIQIISDTHFDVDPVFHAVRLGDGVEVVVAAGDICEGAENAFQWLRRTFGNSPRIVCVAGNHTFYRRCLGDELAVARATAPNYGIDFLEDDTVTIGNIRFVGATLWTDYRLFGDAFRINAIYEARDKMMDHKRIAWSKAPWTRFRPQEAEQLHNRSMNFFENSLAQKFGGKTVVVTHHAPTMKSVPEHFKTAILSCAYASELSAFIDRTQPDIWIHGHIHSSSDYEISSTRIICNPHGYGRENLGFDPVLTIDL